VNTRQAEGVLLTGVYGSGKSSVAEEIAYLLEQRGEPYALLDLDYLSWAGTGTDDRAAGFGLMLQNLAAVAANYRRAGSGCSCWPTLSAAPAKCSACERR
jgi:adenylylsulfate kinase